MNYRQQMIAALDAHKQRKPPVVRPGLKQGETITRTVKQLEEIGIPKKCWLTAFEAEWTLPEDTQITFTWSEEDEGYIPSRNGYFLGGIWSFDSLI